MGLVDSSIDDSNLHSGTSVTLASYCGPEGWSPDQGRGSVHLQVVKGVVGNESCSRSVQKTVHRVPVQLNSNGAQDNRGLVDNLDCWHIIFQPSFRRLAAVRQVRRVVLGGLWPKCPRVTCAG